MRVLVDGNGLLAAAFERLDFEVVGDDGQPTPDALEEVLAGASHLLGQRGQPVEVLTTEAGETRYAFDYARETRPGAWKHTADFGLHRPLF